MGKLYQGVTLKVCISSGLCIPIKIAFITCFFLFVCLFAFFVFVFCFVLFCFVFFFSYWRGIVPIFKMIPNLRRPVAYMLRKWREMRYHFVQKVYGSNLLFGVLKPFRTNMFLPIAIAYTFFVCFVLFCFLLGCLFVCLFLCLFWVRAKCCYAISKGYD